MQMSSFWTRCRFFSYISGCFNLWNKICAKQKIHFPETFVIPKFQNDCTTQSLNWFTSTIIKYIDSEQVLRNYANSTKWNNISVISTDSKWHAHCTHCTLNKSWLSGQNSLFHLWFNVIWKHMWIRIKKKWNTIFYTYYT